MTPEAVGPSFGGVVCKRAAADMKVTEAKVTRGCARTHARTRSVMEITEMKMRLIKDALKATGRG